MNELTCTHAGKARQVHLLAAATWSIGNAFWSNAPGFPNMTVGLASYLCSTMWGSSMPQGYTSNMNEGPITPQFLPIR